jgi:hypothetical protein
MEIAEQTDREENFLLMSFGFIMCALIFIICGQPLSRDNHLENITNIFILVIAMYVILSLHILHPTQWARVYNTHHIWIYEWQISYEILL